MDPPVGTEPIKNGSVPTFLFSFQRVNARPFFGTVLFTLFPQCAGAVLHIKFKEVLSVRGIYICSLSHMHDNLKLACVRSQSTSRENKKTQPDVSLAPS